MGSFVFRWPYPANDVHVTGTFDDWGKSIQLEKHGNHWEKEVELPSAEDKVFYKFIVDGEWIVDERAPKEGDGHYNTNNVLYPYFIKRKGATEPGVDDIPGAFPESPATEAPTFGVAPIPFSSGMGNPISLPAGAPIPDQKGDTARDIGSSVTTSKEDYEKAGSSALPTAPKEANEYSINPLPGTAGVGNPIAVPAGSTLPDEKQITSNTIDSNVTTSKEDYEKAGSSTAIPAKADEPSFSVQPIPASSGVGNPVSLPAGAALPVQKDVTQNTIGSTATTSKEDYENAGSSAAVPGLKADEPAFGIQPIPASSGIGNPISLPAGAAIPDQKEITPNTVDSTVTTSKEAYENAGSSAFPAYAAAGVGAAGAAIGGAALGSAFSVPKEKNNLIPESSLPMGTGKTDTLDAGPFISSSGPGTTTADLASKAPLETSPFISSSGPGTTTADLASNVPFEQEGFSSALGGDRRTSQLASELEVPLKHSPFMSSVGTAATTSELASQVPPENDPFIRSSGPGTTTSDLAAQVPLQNEPFIRSAGSGTTTAALAAAVPLEDKNVPEVVKESISAAHQDPEAVASPDAVKEKADLEKELLSKTKASEATGDPASAASEQTSYYGLATSVPETVEQSMQQAHAAPEAAAESSVVAEKSAMEAELMTKVPSTDEAGEPAPTIAAVTSATAPTTLSAEATASNITDGRTANQTVPDTDTSSAARGVSAGELAGGAAVGGAAALGAATLAARHHDADAEPPRVADSQKPDISTEASPATASKEHVPGQSRSAAAAVSDGAFDTSTTQIPKSTAPVETSEAATTEYAPMHASGVAPGVSSSAAAALSDGTEDPTLADEPAVKMMRQHDGSTAAATSATASTAVESTGKDLTSTAPVHDSTTMDPTAATSSAAAVAAAATSTAPVHEASTTAKESTTATSTSNIVDANTMGNKDPSAVVAAAGVPSLTSAGTQAPDFEKKATEPTASATPAASEKKDVGPSTTVASAAQTGSPSTPSKKSTAAQSSAANSPVSRSDSTKKRHRLSRLWHKIVD